MRREYIIFGGLLAVIALAVTRLRSNTVAVPSLIPVSTVRQENAGDARDPYRVQAFTALASLAQGSQQVAAQKETLLAQIEAEKIRAGAQRDVLQQAIDLERLRLPVQRELGLAALDAATRQRELDAQTQLEAIREMGRQANAGTLSNGLLAAINQALRALSQPRSGSGGSGGSGGGMGPSPQRPSPQRRPGAVPVPNIGPVTPPFVPGYPTPGLSDFFEPPDYWFDPGLPFSDFPDFDWLPDIGAPSGSGGYLPEGEGDLYIPGIDPAPGYNWWDWGGGDSFAGGGSSGQRDDYASDFDFFEDYYWGE